MGMSMSSTEANYTNGDQRITLEINDTALEPDHSDADHDDDKGRLRGALRRRYKKASPIGVLRLRGMGQEPKHGEVTMIVADRLS